MAREYRVWTKNAFGSYSVMNDWTTYAKCLRFIIARWGHVPPWAFISQAQTTENFIRANGE